MHEFPSNVAGMIVLFFLLMCSHTAFPKFTDKLVLFIDPYSSFALRSMNIMFVPAVVGIVNNPPTTGNEVGRMICVFIVAYVVGFVLCTFIVRGLRIIIFAPFISKLKKQKLDYDTSTTPNVGRKEKIEMHKNRTLDEEEVYVNTPTNAHLNRVSSVTTFDTTIRPLSDDDAASCVSTLNHYPSAVSCRGENSAQTTETTAADCSSSNNNNAFYEPFNSTRPKKHGPLHSFAIWCMEQSTFDDLTLFIIFCLCAFIFLPLPEDNLATPFFRLFLYFTMTILLYSAACRLPPQIRIVVHPIILCSACTMAGIAYFERVKGFDIKHGVNLYKTGITFISLVEKTNVGWPGGGDILGAAMDVAIISLAFNVYKSRPNSLREWIIVFSSIAPMAFLIMFVTPLFAHGIGCSPADSLVWASRSVTTAIGIVIGNVLGADGSVVTCIIVFTGIMGPICGPYLFKLARVRDDDYMTIGITMGCSSHGVGTAYLISKNPKASGMASIAFAVFGTIGVIVASIPALSDTIRHLSGY
ncbi:LrgB-like family-domain-containing protein [Parasitella parasitica]|nr:LrgB-like family-domain-containing protein [Parasitella parasitica]